MRSPLLAIFLIVVVDVLGLTIMLPLLPFYAEHFGATPAVVGLLVSTYALCQLVAGPVLGQMSDHLGRKPVLTASQIGTFVGFLVLAFAPNLFIVFLARVIDGLTAGNLSIAQAYIADVTRPKERARAFAVMRFIWHGVPFGPKEVGYVFMYSGLLGIVVQGSMRQGALVRRIGEARLVTVGFFSGAVGYALLGVSFAIPPLLLAATLASFGTGVLRPALTSLITQQVSRSEQGVVLGLNQSLLSIALIVGPAIAGVLIEHGHLTLWGLWAAVILAAGLLLNLRAREARLAAAQKPREAGDPGT